MEETILKSSESEGSLGVKTHESPRTTKLFDRRAG
jgi:hypothetical protein